MTLNIPVYQPSEFFPATVEQQASVIRNAVSDLSDEDIAWISENRDFAEAERYREKDEVDEALVSSSLVTHERANIEDLFRAHDAVRAVKLYLLEFKQHMAVLHGLFAGAVVATDITSELDTDFWRKAIAIADADNAHAMYLSSDNWPFSVFHKLLDELANLVGDDQASMASILLAGIQDARTSVYGAFGSVYRDLKRHQFVTRIRDNVDWIRQDGIMPMFAFKAATEGMPNSMRPPNSGELRQKYEAAVNLVASRLSGIKAQRFMDACKVYQRLYAARAAYDIYEYFGFYAFARHLLILRGRRILESSSFSEARSFHYFASTYQFSKLEELLNSSHKEIQTS